MIIKGEVTPETHKARTDSVSTVTSRKSGSAKVGREREREMLNTDRLLLERSLWLYL